MRRLAKRLIGLVGAAWIPLAVAQSNLGEVLDAGGKPLSAEAFREELVQRTLFGRSPSGGELEFMYVPDGRIVGSGRHPLNTGIPLTGVGGTWKIDDEGKICTNMRIGGIDIGARCQIWFKLGETYFVSDSDTDRRMRVLARTLKP